MFRRRVSQYWPVRVSATTPRGQRVDLRALTPDDEAAFVRLRRDNASWLSPWDATNPLPGTRNRSYAEMLRAFEDDAHEGRALPFGVEFGGDLVGQVNLSNIILGAFRSCSAGYWVARDAAGRGIIPTALAAAIDYAFTTRGLHRVEVNIRPENTASLAVVTKLGLRDEGLRERMLHIDGDWRDHRSFAVTAEELGGGRLMDRLAHQSHESL